MSAKKTIVTHSLLAPAFWHCDVRGHESALELRESLHGAHDDQNELRQTLEHECKES